MLVEFSVSNYRSIRERQAVSLAANTGKELRDSHVMESGAPATPDLLRSVVIYGANASGKSNLLYALMFVRDFVRQSATQRQHGEAIAHQPFALGLTEGEAGPSEFEVVFVQHGTRYQYGLSVTREAVLAEWLYAYPEGRAQLWFRRQAKAPGDKPDWEFGPSLRGQKAVWRDATRPNAAFLSTAVQLNAEQLKPVYDWFVTVLRQIQPYARVSADFTAQQCSRAEGWKEQVVDFLARADLGITDVRVDMHKFDPATIDSNMPEPLRVFVSEQMKDSELAEVRLTHKDSQGRALVLPLEQESGGTQKLFDLAGPWIDVLANGYVLTIDELDTSLHPQLLRHLVRLFNHPASNPKGAQLIFTTHDTSLLDVELFRRDQIWFMEKDAELASHLYPLTDFSPRKGENLEKGYLQGRYGALPVFSSLLE